MQSGVECEVGEMGAEWGVLCDVSGLRQSGLLAVLKALAQCAKDS